MSEIKMKKCESCGELFMPFRTFDKACSYKCSVNLKTKENPKQRTSVLRSVSTKRKEQNKEYSVIRNEFLKSHLFCQICQKRSTEIHHMNGRSNQRLLDTKHFLPVCRSCHNWIHQNPSEARELGYLL